MANYGGANTPANPTAGNITGGQAYGDLSKNDAFTIQKRMLPIAKRLLTFAKFAQKETKPQKSGLEIRHRRYERFPIVDQPIAEGVTPDFTTIDQTTLKHTLKQYGSYVNTTDVMYAAAQDPMVKIVTERQAQQAGETLDYLAYKVFRAGTQRKCAGGQNRGDVDFTINNCEPTAVGNPAAKQSQTAGTGLIDTAIRKLEQQDAKKMRKMIRASTGIATEPIKESFIAICHPDLRQDLEANPSWVPLHKYSDPGPAIEGEAGSINGVRFIFTTQAVPFKNAGQANATNQFLVGQDSGTTKCDVYPVIILAEDFGGCATLGGMDSLRSKIVAPKPGPGDPLGQRGTVAWDTWYSCIILQDLWMYRLEVACTKF